MSNTTIQDARAAIAAAVTTGGLACYAYESADVPTQLGAELALDDWDAAASPNQQLIYTRLGFALRVYQPVTGNWNQALAYLDASMGIVLTSLGADPTVGGAVRYLTVTGGQMEYERYASGTQVAIATFRLDVTPHPGQ